MLLAVLSICVLASGADAAVFYVDSLISPASCTSYSPAGRSCGSGSDTAHKTLAGGLGAAFPGDTVQVRAGTYGERLVPPRSGTAAAPITIRRYLNETVILANQGNPSFALTGRTYLVIDGINATANLGFARLEDSSFNVIQNCAFSDSTGGGTTSGFKLVRATHNRILNNSFVNATDNMTIQDSDRNVIQGNVFDRGAHSLLSLRCGNFNVIRGNSFRNPDQKALEIYDCEGTSDAPIKLDATKRNVVEGNIVSLTRASSQSNDYNGIQFAGQRAIVRRNVFHDNLGGGVNFQEYSDEALFNYQNRLYHNTFYDNRCFGIIGDNGNPARYYDHRVRNNILYKNLDCSGSGGQTSIANPAQVILTNNAITTTPPGFVDENGNDFHLVPGSPMIDAAAFLTTTVGAGSGSVVTVADSRYFFDGYGIAGEVGDLVQLQGQTQTARVLAVDDTAGTLTLDRTLTWTTGQGLTLAYNGAGPDQGAFEYVPAGPPALTISDVTANEGSSGTTSFTFTLSLSFASSQTVTVNFATADGTATSPADYAAASGSRSFSPGQVSQTVTVSVVGETVFEANETFSVDLSGAVNATIADAQGVGTIVNDDLPSLSIDDVSVTEGHTGATVAAFTVTMSAPRTVTVTVNYAAVAGTATAGVDFGTVAGAAVFPPGTTSRTVAVPVLGDRIDEADETFFINLSGPSGATVADGSGQGTILDDDSPGFTISDVAVREGVTPSTAIARFTVSLTPPGSQIEIVNWATADGTATAAADYLPGAGVLTFDPGVPIRTLDVTVNADALVEGMETFMVNLSGSTGPPIVQGTGTARVLDAPAGGDFNADDRNDLLWRHDVSGQNVLWFMNGPNLISGTFTTPPTLTDVRWKMVGTNDFNADGRPDILWRHSFSGENVLWFMNGSVLTTGTFLTPATLADVRWGMAGTGDFNLDGKPDILWRHSSSGEIVVWFMNGSVLQSGTFLTPSAFTDVNWQTVGTGDFNSDGKTDILWRHAVSGQNVVWFLEGTSLVSGAFTNPPTLADVRWRMVATGDYNFDGKVDIVWRHSFSGQNVLWFMDGINLIGGSFTNPSMPDTSWKIVGPR